MLSTHWLELQEDALLADLEASPAPNGSAKKASPAKAAAETPQEVPVQEMTSIEDVQAAMDAPGVSKTRKQKLKQRLKQLQVSLSHALIVKVSK